MANDELSHDLASLRIRREAAPASGSWLRRVVWLVALGALAAGAWAGKGQLEQRLVRREVSVTQVTQVAAGQADVTFTATGYVVARRKAVVAPRVPGRLVKVLVEEGQAVKAGDRIAELDAEDARANQARLAAAAAAARSRINVAQADVAEASRVVQREERLVASGASTRDVVATARARLDAARAAERAARAEASAAAAAIPVAKVGVEAAIVTAPFDGVVVRKLAEVGEYVAGGGSIGAAVTAGGIALLADFGSLEIETEVTESRLSTVAPGGPTELVLDAYPDQRFRGEVSGVRPTVERAKATTIVWVKLVDSPPRLLPDMAAKVRFLSKPLETQALTAKPKLVVPGSALVERGDQRVVFVLTDGKAVQAPVTVGAAVGSAFELLQGPPPGTRLVDSPPADLSDGAAVKEKGAS